MRIHIYIINDANTKIAYIVQHFAESASNIHSKARHKYSYVKKEKRIPVRRVYNI